MNVNARARRVIIESADFDIGNVAPAVIRHFIVPKWPHSVISRRNQAGRYVHIDGDAVRACVRACLPASLLRADLCVSR